MLDRWKGCAISRFVQFQERDDDRCSHVIERHHAVAGAGSGSCFAISLALEWFVCGGSPDVVQWRDTRHLSGVL